jgi:carboxypeptidase family protein
MRRYNFPDMRLMPGVVVALLFVSAAAAQVQSPDVDGGRIAGHVITAYAETVADAAVTLTRVTDQRPGSRIVTTKTDGSGAFSFVQLPEGRYRVTASKPGFTSRQPPPAAPEPAPSTFETGSTIELAAGAQELDVQVVMHRTASIAGRIIRPDGSAAPDVQVQLAVGSGRSRLTLFEARATSQYDGRYEITGLPPGEYLVGAMNVPMPTRRSADGTTTTQVERESLRSAVTAATTAHWSWYPGVPDSEPGTAVTLLEGINAEGIDIWLTPSQRFAVSGRVFWPVGVAVENITIDYGDPGGTRSGVSFVSDPGGLFTLLAVAPGALTLLARAETDQGPMIGIASTEVSVDSVEDVRIVVDRPGVVAGRVVYEGNVPQASRATSIVVVQKLFKVSAIYPVPESTVDSNGRFELAGTIGEYEFALNGLARGLVIKRVIRNGRLLPMNRIGVAGGETIRDIEIVVGQ